MLELESPSKHSGRSEGSDADRDSSLSFAAMAPPMAPLIQKLDWVEKKCEKFQDPIRLKTSQNTQSESLKNDDVLDLVEQKSAPFSPNPLSECYGICYLLYKYIQILKVTTVALFLPQALRAVEGEKISENLTCH